MSAKPFDQIQAQIQRGIHTATAIEISIFGNHEFRHPAHFGIFLAKTFSKAPMSCGTLAVEHAGSGDKAYTGAHTGDRHSALPPSLQPRDDWSVAFQHVVNTHS